MLYLIGIGLGNEKDISVNALEIVKKCDKIYLESYTSVLNCSVEDMENLYGKKVIVSDRDLVEKKAEDTILKDAEKEDVAFLVVGDVFGATTHVDLTLRAKKKGIEVKYFHNASIMNAVGITGLELYKFGKTTSMVFFEDNWKPTTAYDVVSMNKENGLHTLVLLDIKTDQNRFMTVNDCLKQFLDIESEKKEGLFDENTKVIGCARVGNDDLAVKYGTIKELIKFDFGKPLHCVIVPGKLHFMEEEFLESY